MAGLASAGFGLPHFKKLLRNSLNNGLRLVQQINAQAEDIKAS